jgi:hypothetical protein
VTFSRPARAYAGCGGSVRVAVMMVAACVAVGLVACSPAGPATPAIQPAPEVPRVAAATIDTSAANAAKTAALDAYNGYLSAYVTASHTADWNAKSIDKYTADPLRQQAKIALHDLLDAHHVMTGQPSSHPVVTALNTSASPATVLLADCVDMTHWIEVQKATGKPVSAAPGGHEAVSVVIVDYPGQGWLVQQSKQSKVPTC